MHHFPDGISSIFSESVPILDCQKVGLLSKISSSSKFSSSARVMSVLLIYQSILVDKDDLVIWKTTPGSFVWRPQSDQPPRRPARTERLLPAWPGRLLPTSITWDRFVVATLVRSPACTKRIYHLKCTKSLSPFLSRESSRIAASTRPQHGGT